MFLHFLLCTRIIKFSHDYFLSYPFTPLTFTYFEMPGIQSLTMVTLLFTGEYKGCYMFGQLIGQLLTTAPDHKY